MLDLVVTNARIVNHDRTFDGLIGVKDEKICLVSASDEIPAARKTIDARQQNVLPGMIDPHTHIGYPTWPLDKAIEQHTKAAIAGGVTTVVQLLIINENIKEGFEQFMELHSRLGYVDISFHASILTPSHIEEIPDLVDMGICSFKFLLPYRGAESLETVAEAGLAGVDDGLVFESFRKIESVGKGAFAMIHAESPELFFAAKERILKEGNADKIFWTDARPNHNENLSMIKICEFAKVTNCPLYFVHMSTREGGEIVRRYRAQGVHVIGETCPQYLCLNVNNADTILSKVNPPLRHKEDNEQLWEEIRNGTISCLGSDDAGPDPSEKTEFWSATVGMPGMQTSLPVMLSEGVNKGRITLERLVEIFSYNPAKVFGLYPAKGAIQVGSDADLVFVDLESEKTIRGEELFHLSKYTPYEGWKVKGIPTTCLIRGKVVMENGQVLGKAGYGKFYPYQINPES